MTKNTNLGYHNNHIHNYNNEDLFQINNIPSHFEDVPLQREVLSGYKSSSSQSSSNRGAVSKQKSIYSINNSFLTNNNNKSTHNASTKDNSQWKSDVQKYLNEVKEKVEPQLFHEFIAYIKLMTGKTHSSVSITNKKVIIDKVKELFGAQHYELFQKFEAIVCLKRNAI